MHVPHPSLPDRREQLSALVPVRAGARELTQMHALGDACRRRVAAADRVLCRARAGDRVVITSRTAGGVRRAIADLRAEVPAPCRPLAASAWRCRQGVPGQLSYVRACHMCVGVGHARNPQAGHCRLPARLLHALQVQGRCSPWPPISCGRQPDGHGRFVRAYV